MKTYDYLAAYNFEKKGYLTHCSGTMLISRTKKIKTIEDVTELTKFIERSIDGAFNVNVYNFILLGRNKYHK